MKKIFIIIVFTFIGSIANAQIITTEYIEEHIDALTSCIELLEVRTKTSLLFVKNNKDTIEVSLPKFVFEECSFLNLNDSNLLFYVGELTNKLYDIIVYEKSIKDPNWRWTKEGRKMAHLKETVWSFYRLLEENTVWSFHKLPEENKEIKIKYIPKD